jgi:hypothetical protein
MKKLSLFFTLIICSVLIILLISTCTKEYSYEGGAFASFTLVGSPGECTSTIISGSYAAGIALDSSDNIQVTAQVTTAGNYTISTNTIDGITFSGSGNFPDTGLYTITLSASGTPDSAGTYQIQIVGNYGCFFSLVVNAKPMADYTLSGNLGDCENPVLRGDYINGMTLGSLNTLTVNVDVHTTGDYEITTDTVAGVFFSSSGTFTATGNQQVILTSNGKPDTPGLIYFHVHGGASECGFTIPIINAEPWATYVLESGFGNPNPCTPQAVNGSYTATTPLSSTNTVDITAFVTYLGNFSISTDSTNGMIFTKTGQFTTLGEQTVTLVGSGTPKTPGTYSFSPQIIGPAPLGGVTCGFDIPVK